MPFMSDLDPSQGQIAFTDGDVKAPGLDGRFFTFLLESFYRCLASIKKVDLNEDDFYWI